MTSFSFETACVVAHPDRLRPSASVRQDIVFAVNRPAQEPGPGHALRSISSKSFWSIFPAASSPTASNMDMTSSFRPLYSPGIIGPGREHDRRARSSLPQAISMPGVILSQFVTPTQPSATCDSTMASTVSATISLDGREYLMPSSPIAMPSQIPGTPNS